MCMVSDVYLSRVVSVSGQYLLMSVHQCLQQWSVVCITDEQWSAVVSSSGQLCLSVMVSSGQQQWSVVFSNGQQRSIVLQYLCVLSSGQQWSAVFSSIQEWSIAVNSEGNSGAIDQGHLIVRPSGQALNNLRLSSAVIISLYKVACILHAAINPRLRYLDCGTWSTSPLIDIHTDHFYFILMVSRLIPGCCPPATDHIGQQVSGGWMM